MKQPTSLKQQSLHKHPKGEDEHEEDSEKDNHEEQH